MKSGHLRVSVFFGNWAMPFLPLLFGIQPQLTQQLERKKAVSDSSHIFSPQHWAAFVRFMCFSHLPSSAEGVLPHGGL
jgi:hypothetical protein